MGIEQAYIEKLKAARARMGMAPKAPVVTIRPLAPISVVKRGRGRPVGKVKLDINSQQEKDRRERQAADRLAAAKDARRRLTHTIDCERVSASAIILICSNYFGISLCDLKKGSCNDRAIALKRHVCVFLVRELCPHLSLHAIASVFGGYDHTSVLYAIRKVREMLPKRDPRVTCDVISLRALIKGFDLEEENYWGA
jgi:hypothetical protein